MIAKIEMTERGWHSIEALRKWLSKQTGVTVHYLAHHAPPGIRGVLSIEVPTSTILPDAIGSEVTVELRGDVDAVSGIDGILGNDVVSLAIGAVVRYEKDFKFAGLMQEECPDMLARVLGGKAETLVERYLREISVTPSSDA